MAAQTLPTNKDIAEAIRELGATVNLETAAQIIGIGRSNAYALANNGDFPVTVHRIGKLYKVPVPALLEFLGLR